MTPSDVVAIIVLLPIAIVALGIEWAENERRDRICAECPVCKERAKG